MNVAQVDSVTFHRNGSWCPGFFTVRFQMNSREYIAIVFDEEPDATDAKSEPHVAVINPGDLGDCFRGDRFVDELWHVIKNWPKALMHTQSEVNVRVMQEELLKIAGNLSTTTQENFS